MLMLRSTHERLMAAEISHWSDEMDDLAVRYSDLCKALGDIANPLAALRRDAEAEGNRLSGMAFQIANDPEYLKSIARHALASVDTHPKGGDALAAPFMSGAVPEGQTPLSPTPQPSEEERR